MSKQSGLGDGLVIDGIDLSGDTNSIGALGGSRTTQQVPGINASAQERIHLLKDGRIEWVAYFNPDPAQAHEELSALPLTNRIETYVRGEGLGRPAASMVAKQINYDPTRNQDGSITMAVSSLANSFGLEWGKQLTTGYETFAGVGNGSALDLSAQTLFGLQAYLHLLAFTGTDVTATIEDSADGLAGWAAVAGGAFPALTGVGSARIQTARDATVRQHLRVALTGTFSSATLLVAVTKNRQEVLF